MQKSAILVLALLLFSCGDKPETKKEKQKFVSQSILIDDSEKPFPHDSIALILEQTGLCKIMDSLSNDTTMPPCDFRLFRYFANQVHPYKNGFLVEIKPEIWSPFFLIVNIAKNKSGEYYKSNAFHGQLLEMKTNERGLHDLIIRYIDTDVGTIAIRHQWRKTKYDPMEVVEINDHFVKPEKKDSLYNIYIKDFVWGY